MPAPTITTSNCSQATSCGDRTTPIPLVVLIFPVLCPRRSSTNPIIPERPYDGDIALQNIRVEPVGATFGRRPMTSTASA